MKKTDHPSPTVKGKNKPLSILPKLSPTTLLCMKPKSTENSRTNRFKSNPPNAMLDKSTAWTPNMHKKSGAQIAPPNHAAEILNELSRKRLWLNFPAANQEELLLLFRSNFLFCDGFLNRFFRGSGLGGFFGHEKLLASFFMNGTQNFSFLCSLYH